MDDRRIGRDIVKTSHDYVVVSTVKLHPLLSKEEEYETMVFQADETGRVYEWRDLDVETYVSREEAEKGHLEMVNRWRGKRMIL